MASEVGRRQDQLANIRLGGLRNRAEDVATSLGQRGGGVNFLSLAQLQAPLQERQERLTGFVGAAANDPQAISNKLNRAQALIPLAQAHVESSVGTPGALDAISNLDKLQRTAGNLKEALEHLSNVAERSAAIQEKLNQIDQDRQSRLSLAEQIATGDPTTLNILNRGAALAQQSQFTGLGGINQPDRKILFDFLNTAGDARLGGVRGAPSAKQFKEQLLGSALPGIANPLGAGQENALRDARAKNFDVGDRAQTLLIENLKGQQAVFFDNLRKLQDDFFSRLGGALVSRPGGAAGQALGAPQ